MLSNNENKRSSWSAGLESQPKHDELDNNKEDAGIKLSTDNDINNNGDLDLLSEGGSSISEGQSSLSEQPQENLISARKRQRVENQMVENEVHIQTLNQDGNGHVEDIDIRAVKKDIQSNRYLKSCIPTIS